MAPFRCLPLSRLCGIPKGHEIEGDLRGDYYYITWNNSELAFPAALLTDILENFFKTSGWYHLGASMTDPIKGGLGDFLQNRQHVWEQHSPRFASMVAAIMVYNKQIEFRKVRNEFELRKL